MTHDRITRRRALGLMAAGLPTPHMPSDLSGLAIPDDRRLDVVPLPGATTVDEIAHLLTDVAAVAHRWDKPLSARLFPVTGKEVGDLVQFENPFLVDARVAAVRLNENPGADQQELQMTAQ